MNADLTLHNRPARMPDWLERFAFGRPVLFSFLVILVMCVLTELPLDGLLPFLGDQAARYVVISFEQFAAGLALVWLLHRLGLLRAAGFTAPRHWKQLWLGWPLLVVTLLNFETLIDGNLRIDTVRPELWLLCALVVLSTGFFEEVLFRGLALRLMLQRWGRTRTGIYAAVIVSNLLFGPAHLLNLIQGRLPLLACLTQVVYALFFGVIFAACVLRNRSIWPMMLVHAVFDFGGSLHELVPGGWPRGMTEIAAGDALVSVLVTLPLFLYGLFILRKVQPEDVAV